MKTSKILMLGVSTGILFFFVIFTFVLKKHVQTIHAANESKLEYKTIVVNDFNRIDLGSGFIVHIRQGKTCHVEYAATMASGFTPRIKTTDGTLKIVCDTAIAGQTYPPVYVRIMVPDISEIRAEKATEIDISYFESDSMHIILEKDCIFSGNNNQFKNVSFETLGKAIIQVKNAMP
jgi:hypothetical protein